MTPSAPHSLAFSSLPETPLLCAVSTLEINEHAEAATPSHALMVLGSKSDAVVLDRKPQRLLRNIPASEFMLTEAVWRSLSVRLIMRSDDPAVIVIPLPVAVSRDIPCCLSSSFIVIWLPPAVRRPEMFLLPEP